MENIFIIEEKCTGCGKCIKACNYNAIILSEKKATINLNECTLCKLCVNSCKLDAISYAKIEKNDYLKNFKGVWVFIEYFDNKINSACLQILSKGYELAKKTGDILTAIVVGENFDDHNNIKSILSEYGAKEVKLLQCNDLKFYYPEDISKVVSEEILNNNPSIVLFLGSLLGRNLAPRISARVKAGLTADCTELDIDSEGNLLQIRPTFGGKILASIICPNSRPQMASVRPNVFESKKILSPHKKLNLSFKRIDIDSIGKLKKIIKTIVNKDKKKSIDDANIVICGGAGVGSKEGFKLLELLADKIGGSIGGTRSVVEKGWIDHSQQIGQTGKIIRPNIYIGCGVSGALQHLVGMRNSKKVIAINKDKEAPILKIADIGVIDDLFNVIPKLINSL
jgi:caffeyl-CoA reductase-Etf complex subunit CarE